MIKNMYTIISLSSLLLACSLSAASDWVPTFSDPPVAPQHVQAINQALPQGAIVAPEAARRVLIFSATAGYRHKSIPTGSINRAMIVAAIPNNVAVGGNDPPRPISHKITQAGVR